MKHQITSQSKLYVVVREDLSHGAQAAQSIHACVQFQYEYPDIAKEWYKTSNYIVNLSAKDINHLELLIEKAFFKGINVSIFREPDFGNEITAVAFEPSDASRKLLSNLPLALKL